MGVSHSNAGEAYGLVVTRRGPHSKPSKLTCETPVDAVVSAIGYLRKGYHVLLTDATVAALAEQGGELDLEWLGSLRGAAPAAAPAAMFVPPAVPAQNNGRAWSLRA
jgi:hypothetical protein